MAGSEHVAREEAPTHEEVGTLRDGLQAILGDRRRLAISVIFGLLLAAGVILLIGRASGFARLTARLREAEPWWLVAALAVQVASIWGYVLAFRGMMGLGNGRRLPPRITANVVLASLGATRLLAAAGAGGLAVNYWALRRTGVSARDAVVRVLALNTVLYAIFGGIGLLAAILLLTTGDVSPSLTVPWLVVVPLCVVAGYWVTRPERKARLARDPGPSVSTSRLVTTTRRGFATAVAAVGQVGETFRAPRRHAELQGGSALYWVGDIACLWCGLRSFGVDVSVTTVVLGYTTGYVANVLPLPTGGVGGVDAAMTFALNALGVPLEGALAGVIAYRFVGFWLPTIPAVVALVRLPRLARAIETAPARA